MIRVKQSLTGNVSVGTKKIQPPLIDLEVTPSKDEQVFNHDGEYGYDEVKVNPISLQDKSITITENGTTNIVADEGYDGLGNVEVTSDVPIGVEPPEVGVLTTDWTENGNIKELRTYGLTSIDSYWIYASGNISIFNSLKKVILNEGITVINREAFRNLTGLKNVALPSTLTELGYGAFYQCTNLELDSLPNSITTIGSNAFYSCTNITLSKLPDNLTTLEATAFNLCKGITIKRIPDGVTKLTDFLFTGCTGLIQMSMKNVASIYGKQNDN